VNLTKPVVVVIVMLAAIGLVWTMRNGLFGTGQRVREAQEADELIEQTREKVDEIEQEAEQRLEQLP